MELSYNRNMKNILFKSEIEMQFWMGIYQTSLRDTQSPTLSGCESLPWEEETEATPAEVADTAIRELRKRMEAPEGRYHNSPQPK